MVMDTKEKLVQLIEKASYECDEGTRDLYDMREVADSIANFLIANGVTMQEWVPVTEKLPKDSATVLVCHKNGLVTTNAWLGAHWWFENERNPINHWMPLPEPPKGE